MQKLYTADQFKVQIDIELFLLLLMSEDVSENPGPTRFPCGKCQKSVKRNQRGIQCESCFLWHHAKCIAMPVSEYNYLSNSSDDWYCYLCTLPPFTDSFFSTNLDETNESIGNFSNAPLVDSLHLTPETTSDVNTNIFYELIDTRKKTSRHFHVLILKHQ